MILLLLLYVTYQTKHKFGIDHNCIHNQVQSLHLIQKSKSLKESEDRRSINDEDEIEWDYIKIKLDYQGDISNDIKYQINAVKSFFESFIKVKSFHKSFQAYNCMDYEYTTIVDYDLIFFVSHSDINCQDSTLAYVMICEINVRDKRPVSGILNICKANFDAYDLYFTLIHEFMHGLGISKHVFDYVNVKQFYHHGKFVPKVISPNALQEAQKYFNCDKLDGIELENDWSHLKKRLYFDNIMSPVYSNEIILSALEFKILEDFYFYEIDWEILNSTLSERIFGRGLGCSFVFNKCNEFHIKNPENTPFCFHLENELDNCTYTHNGKGFCNIKHYLSFRIPDRFRYIDHGVDSSGNYIDGANLGGPKYMEYCPFYQERSMCDSGKKCFGLGKQECYEYICNDVAIKIDNIWVNCSNDPICPNEIIERCKDGKDSICEYCIDRDIICPYIKRIACIDNLQITITNFSKELTYNVLIFFVIIFNIFIT